MNQKVTALSSKRTLFFIFILALLVFSLLRWDMSSWLSAQIQQAAKQTGMNIQYEHISVTGFTVQLNQLKISKSNILSIQVQELKVSLAWDALLSGELGVNIESLWQTNPLSFTIIQQGDRLQIQHIDAVLDISRIPQLTTSIPARVSGVVKISGDIRINPNTQQLEGGNLDITWNQAKAGLTQPKFTLGDYQINIFNDQKNNQPWHWDILGGSGVALKGNGTLLPQSPNPQSWPISGLISAKVDQTNPSLAMMVQSMMGTTENSLRISGTLGKPRTEIVR